MLTTTREVTALRRDWYERLRASGFRDIEYETTDMLRVACRENRGGVQRDVYDASIEYYSRAAAMLHHYPWTDSSEYAVWRLHCDGASTREIARARGLSHPQLAWRIVERLRERLAQWWPNHTDAVTAQLALPRVDAPVPRQAERPRAAAAAARPRAAYVHPRQLPLPWMVWETQETRLARAGAQNRRSG